MTGPKHFAVIGDPIAHSRSPAMHAAAYRALQMPHTYEAIRATNDDLPKLVQALREGALDGLNVTVPYKSRILDLVDEVHVSAAIARASNTLVRTDDGRVRAHNTDATGLAFEVRDLAPEIESDADSTLDGGWGRCRCLVIGAGGAARSALVGLAVELGVAEIAVRARGNAGRAMIEELGPGLRRAGASSRLVVEPFAADPAAEARTAVVIQATSAGMTGADPGDGVAGVLAWADLPPRAVAIDIVYAPAETPFLGAANQHGFRCVNGLGMLARQGALSFSLWLGVPPPYNAMLTALV